MLSSEIMQKMRYSISSVLSCNDIRDSQCDSFPNSILNCATVIVEFSTG
jgi:hypothetical protein